MTLQKNVEEDEGSPGEEGGVPEPNSEADLKENQKKWGAQTWAMGWTGVPYVLLAYQKRLGLDPDMLNVLLQLLKHWWRAEDWPYVGKKEIAAAMNTSERTVQRALSRLRKKGFVEQKKRVRQDGSYTTPRYDLSGLVAEVDQYAREEKEHRKVKQEKDQEKRTRKGLRAVKGKE
ncbi:helix-turn-helix domain-containing protein [Corallococcus interemptor]|uniref:MarR family transcriptional regulator n=1 Tax=Corallococcus interemptor TaxID=2316720 RepID=UPI0035D4D0A1